MPSITPSEAVERSYSQIRSSASEAVWISLQDETAAREEARAVEEAMHEGKPLPLAGMTFAVKDNIDVRGFGTTAAHPEFERVPHVNASVVDRIRAAGAVFIGKTNLDQFATGLVGTRSPYGRPSSVIAPDRVSGGSSSGSAVAVAAGMVDFALGTDTAGSGRVPAAFNGIVGLKPTYGLVAADGVVPACPSYDCVSVFASTVALSARVLNVIQGSSSSYSHSRSIPPTAPLAAPKNPVIAVPDPKSMDDLPAAYKSSFDSAIVRLVELGASIREIDLSPFIEAGKLLYDGGLVAERFASFGEFIIDHPTSADPLVRRIAERAGRVTGSQVIASQQRLAELTSRGRQALRGSHALMIPTAPSHPMTEDVVRDNSGDINSNLGKFTNFVNLMDFSAIAIPLLKSEVNGGFGVTIVSDSFHDQVGIDIASRLRDEDSVLAMPGGVDVAVFGAHMTGQPLNAHLQELGARLISEITTTDSHRIHLADGEIPRPIVGPASSGIRVPGELWKIPEASVAKLLCSLKAPLGLGPVNLSDGRTVCGFIGRVDGTEPDITSYGSWRAYISSLTRNDSLV